MDRHVYQTSFASLRKKRRLFLWRWSILPYFEWFMQSSRKKRMNFLWRWIMWTTCQLKSVVSSMIEASFKGFLHSLRSVEVNMYILTVIVSTASRQLLNEAATQTWVAVSFKHHFVYKNVCKCVCGLSNYLIISKIVVEMGGIEPPSKHRTRELSTRLVCLWFSILDCRKTGYPELIL